MGTDEVFHSSPSMDKSPLSSSSSSLLSCTNRMQHINFNADSSPKATTYQEVMSRSQLGSNYAERDEERSFTAKLGGVADRRQSRLRSRRNASAGLTSKEAMEIKKLREAVQAGDEEKVDNLIDAGCDVSAPDDKGRTALHFASAKGNLKIVQRLLAQGADVNRVDHIGNTPLHLATCTSQIPVVTLLLKAGSDVTLMDRAGRTPLSLARSRLRILRQSCTDISACVQMEQELIDVMDLMRAFFTTTSTRLPSPSVKEVKANLDDLCTLMQPVSLNDNAIASAEAELGVAASGGGGGGGGAGAEGISSKMDAILEQFDRTCSLMGGEGDGKE